MDMEESMSSSIISKEDVVEDEDVPLPGFRFHPTDEELVGFYLRRMIEKTPLRIDLIKQIDIYKYDPWDLPKANNVGDKEWYFFSKRGRKYRNSIRPNRVTCSGFWKATGIDRPIYSAASGENRRECIGLKKSLVYYRGSAGKGTKTDWMMHEFRLPAEHDDKSTKYMDTKSATQEEAEVWTLCRILKRSISYKKCNNIPDCTEILSAKRYNPSKNANFDQKRNYISFNNTPLMLNYHSTNSYNQLITGQHINPVSQPQFLSHSAAANSANNAYYSNSVIAADPQIDEILKREDYWNELTQLF